MSIRQVWTSKHLRLQRWLVFHIRFQAMNLRQVETFLLEQLDDAPTEAVALINFGWSGDGRAVFVHSCYPPGNQHIPPWEKENHLQNPIFGGYVNSLEGTIKNGPPQKRKLFLLKAIVSSAGSQLNSQGDGHWYGCTTGSGPIGGWVAQEVPRLRSSWLKPFKLKLWTIKTVFFFKGKAVFVCFCFNGFKVVSFNGLRLADDCLWNLNCRMCRKSPSRPPRNGIMVGLEELSNRFFEWQGSNTNIFHPWKGMMILTSSGFWTPILSSVLKQLLMDNTIETTSSWYDKEFPKALVFIFVVQPWWIRTLVDMPFRNHQVCRFEIGST